MSGADAQALTYLEEALAISRALGDAELQRDVLFQIGDVRRNSGDAAAALRCYEECLALASESGRLGDAGRLRTQIALLHQNTGDLAAAVDQYDAALRGQGVSGDRKGEQLTLRCFASLRTAQGDHESAHRMLAAALAIVRELRLEEEPAVLLDLWEASNECGGLFERRADYPAALERYHDALDLARGMGDVQRESAALSNIGMVHVRTGAYREALDELQCSLTLSRRGEGVGPDREATLLNNLGMANAGVGQFAAARALYDEALRLARGSGSAALLGAVLNNSGELRRLTADPRGAMREYEESLALRAQVGDQSGRARVLNNMGLVYNHGADCGRALQCFFEAFEIHRAGGSRWEECSALNNIGAAFRRTGEYQKALRYYQDALVIEQQIGARSAAAHTVDNIGQIHLLERRYGHALESQREALTIRKAIGDKRGVAVTLSSIGGILQDMGAREKAVACYREALDIAQDIGDLDGAGSLLNNLATAYQDSGDLQSALASFHEALDARTRAGDIEGRQQTLGNLGRLHERLDDQDAALRCYREAIVVLERMRTSAGGAEEREALLEKNIRAYQQIVSLLIEHSADGEAFDYAERSRARSLADLLQEAAVGASKSLDPELIARRDQLHHAIAGESSTEGRTRLERELDAVTHRIRAAAPRYADVLAPEPVTLKVVQEDVLRHDEVLLQFFESGTGLHAFVVGRHSMRVVTAANSRAVFDAVRALVEHLHASEPERFEPQRAYELYALLFAPIDAAVREACEGRDPETLIVSPDGALAYFPLEMLVTAPPGAHPISQLPFLGSRYSIVYTASATALARDRRSTEPRVHDRDILTVAPFADDADGVIEHARDATRHLVLSDTLRAAIEGATALPNTLTEARSISAMYDRSSCLVGSEATKEVVRHSARGYRYLHFATHGHLDSAQPAYSGLMLADGILQAWEIFDLETDAEMVVMSTCESGLGKLRRGEGLVGLTRAFLYAGVRSLVVSLWRVSDVSTELLMTRMYANVKNGMSVARALREARTWMLRDARQLDEYGYERTFDNPFYWAPFILTGAYD